MYCNSEGKVEFLWDDESAKHAQQAKINVGKSRGDLEVQKGIFEDGT